MNEIRIATDKIEMLATLNDTSAAARIWDALPIESTVNTWGQEIYFSIPVQCDLGVEARDRMEVGEIGYWPTGSAFCIFFGKTPASKGDEPRAASPVNPIGRVEGDVKVFRQIRDGDTIRVEQVESAKVAEQTEEAEEAETNSPKPGENPEPETP
ncbi:MAG: cyclophilin-like fold protein [Phycisphaerae bacterium]